MEIAPMTCLDLTRPRKVEISIDKTGERLWVDVDGVCRFRVTSIGTLVVEDGRLVEQQQPNDLCT